MTTMVHHPANDLLLEFEDSAVATMSLSHLSLDLMPGMVKSSSLGSLSVDCDSDSTSVRSPSPLYNLSSPRAIFDSYWSASTTRRKKGVMKTTTLGEDDEVLARLQATLRLPSMVDDENDQTDDTLEPQSQEVVCSSSSSPSDSMVRQPSSLDDTLVDYQAAMANARAGSHSTRTTRRQILPSPPPPPHTASLSVSPSLYIPPSSSPLILPGHNYLSCQSSTPLWWFGMRPWSSTSALHAKQPSQSCLRKSRYSSFSGNISQTGSSDDDDKYHNRSVSFYSQVSVLEFTVPQEQRSQEGWSKYFV